MPFKSPAQRRLFYAAASGKSDKIAPGVAKKFIADSQHEGKRPVKGKRKKK